MRHILFVISTVFFAGYAHGAMTGLPLVKSVVTKYQQAPAVEVDITKTVTLALLGEENKSDGRLIMSKGLLRLETKTPHESLIVVGKDVIWVMTPTPEDLGGRPQVMKIRSRQLKDQARAPLASLLGQPKAWDEFKVLKEVKTDDKVTLDLKPKKAGALGEIVSVRLEIDSKKKTLVDLADKDELDNETRFTFRNTNFAAAVKPANFQYTPPKNAEVTNY